MSTSGLEVQIWNMKNCQRPGLVILFEDGIGHAPGRLKLDEISRIRGWLAAALQPPMGTVSTTADATCWWPWTTNQSPGSSAPLWQADSHFRWYESECGNSGCWTNGWVCFGLKRVEIKHKRRNLFTTCRHSCLANYYYGGLGAGLGWYFGIGLPELKIVI